MSGRSSLWLAVVFVLAAGGLSAQFLPDLGEFEVEDVRLILLDDDGQRLGVLTGERANKQRDGDVVIQDAELSVNRRGGQFVLTSPEFRYRPDTSDFEAPEGVSVNLPDEGLLTLPAAEGSIDLTEGVLLTVTSTGEGRLRSGPEGSELVNATVVDPVVTVDIDEVVLDDGDEDFVVQTMSVTGNRGGELKLRLADLPAVERQPEEPTEAVVTVSCFGDVSLTVDGASNASLTLLRRAQMVLEESERTFEVTSNSLRISGRIQETREEEDGETRASLTGLAIDADQNVRLLGEGFNGTAAGLRYREFSDHDEINLSGDPQLDLAQGPDESGDEVHIALRSRQYATVLIPRSETPERPSEISVELFESARVARVVNESPQWRIAGRMVRLFSWRQPGDDEYSHTFDVYAEGYGPLLRVQPVDVIDNELASGMDRAAVNGARAEGTIIGSRIETRVYGPDIMAVVDADYPLADMLRTSLGLIPPPKDGRQRARRDGRLTVRASTLLDVELLSAGDVADVGIAAAGSVELDHRSLPRDDENLLTLTGDAVGLAVRGGEIRTADVSGPGAVATLGFDLLLAEGIKIRRRGLGVVADVRGPGRLVLRAEESIAYFREQLDRLPRYLDGIESVPPADAAWLNFGTAFRMSVNPLSRSLEGAAPVFHVVHGGFELPRAGRAAVDDLPELLEPDVLSLYVIAGDHIYAESVATEPDTDPIHVMRLEGNARVNSIGDGVVARAERDIELSGSDDQRRPESPFSVIMRGNPYISLRNAGQVFGDGVRSGAFNYDGQWRLSSVDRLELTIRPLVGDGGEIDRARDSITEALRDNAPMFFRADRFVRARDALAGAEYSARDQAGAQRISAHAELVDAVRYAQMSMGEKATGHPGYRTSASRALAAARRARALLSGLIDIVGQGNMHGLFESTEPGVSPLTVELGRAIFTFNGLGELAAVDGEGSIAVSRGGYTLRGNRLSHKFDPAQPRTGGTLTLDGASIDLPDETGMTISGIESVSLTRREEGSMAGEAPRRTMVTRVSGKDLKVKVRLTPPEEE